MLCTDGIIILMCHCMVLASPGMLPNRVFVYIYVICIYYMHMQIISHYPSMYVSVYRISISIPPLLITLKQKGFLLVIFAMPDILIICCILIYCSIRTSVCYCHIIIFDCHYVVHECLCCLLCCYCGLGLGDGRFHRHVDVYMFLLFSYKKSNHSYCHHIP